MTFKEFLGHCTAQGGNWTKMLMTGIKEVFPEYWEAMPDKTYEFQDILQILRDDLKVDFSEEEQR